MPTQAGYCYGFSNQLNAVEWHISSEVNVAITPMILFLGSVQDIVDRKIDSSKIKAFYVILIKLMLFLIKNCSKNVQKA